MTADKPPTSPIADDLRQLQVAQSLDCARCGYDVRGLFADGDCPECGEPIRLTIIDVVDPASRRLAPISRPVLIGNALMGIVLFYFISFTFAVTALFIHAHESLPVPLSLQTINVSWLLWGSSVSGLLSFLHLAIMFHMCQKSILDGCRIGIILTGIGLIGWTVSMILIPFVLQERNVHTPSIVMLFDTVFPVLAGCVVFSGFRKLVPRLGLRSSAFRQAQSSRQRMNDLLAALVVIVVGRTLTAVTPPSSNLSFLGTIIIVMSISLVEIGLGYLLRNTLWIRRALIKPPPALSELLRSE